VNELFITSSSYYCIKSNLMKVLTSFMAMLLCAGTSFAQIKLISNQKPEGISNAFSKVLMDYPYNFRNVSGELELAQAEIENYESKIKLPGAESCLVTRYHSGIDTTASWQAVMFRSEEFDKAVKQYQQAFKQLNNSSIRLVDGSAIYLKGVFESAKEEAAFTTSTLKLQTGDDRFKNVKVEIEILYNMPEWVVYINIVSKERDDEVRPTWMGSAIIK